MHRKTSTKDGSRPKSYDERIKPSEKPAVRLSEQKLANLREIIRHQQSQSRLLSESTDSNLAFNGDPSLDSEVSTRRLHRDADPVASNDIAAQHEFTSPVRSRKVAKKSTDPDEEENHPATPLLPGKIRVDSLKYKQKKETKNVEKVKQKTQPSQKPLNSIVSKNTTSKGAHSNISVSQQSNPTKQASSKRIRNDQDIRAYKRGLEVAWQVIGPPAHPPPIKRKSPEVPDAKPKRKPLDTGLKKHPFTKRTTQGSHRSNENLDKATTETDDSTAERTTDTSNAESVKESSASSPATLDSKLPSVAKSIMQDLKSALDNKDGDGKLQKAKSSIAPAKPKQEPKKHEKEQAACTKRSRPINDREAIQNYIRQQRLARHSAEQQKKAEQARLEREKQARLQALFQRQQAVARVPVKELLPENPFYHPPKPIIKIPSSFQPCSDESLAEENEHDNSNVENRRTEPKIEKDNPSQKDTSEEQQSTIGAIANARVPDVTRTKRVCAILESALSLQVKLRAEVDRVERFINNRTSNDSESVLKTPVSVTKFDALPTSKRNSASFLHDLSENSVSSQPQVRDSSTSPMFLSPERPKSEQRTLTPESPTKSSIGTSPLSISHVEPPKINVLPMKQDAWNVASVIRRSFGTTTTPKKPVVHFQDAGLQTTILEQSRVASPTKVTSDVAIQSNVPSEPVPHIVVSSLETTAELKPVEEPVVEKPETPVTPPRRYSELQSRIQRVLKEESEHDRVPVEVLDAQLHAELDLLASLDGYHRQLDDLERQRTTAEQSTDVAGLVSLMNAVESHVTRLSVSRPNSKAEPPKPQEPPKSEPPPPPPKASDFDVQKDFERRFQVLEAATGRRMAEDSERLLEAHLRTSIAVSDLTRQLADIQRQSLIGGDQHQQVRSAGIPPPPPPAPEQQVRYHRRQTFSPPRPPPNRKSPIYQQEDLPKSEHSVEAKSISESITIPEKSSSTSSSSSTMSVSSKSSPKPTDTSMHQSSDDRHILSEMIAQQARQSALRFRSDIAELTLREREAKKRANAELKLLEKQKAVAVEKSDKVEVERLNKMKVSILTSYAKEKKHLENLKKSSTRLASEQRNLAVELRRSLPAIPSRIDEASFALSETADDHDLSMQLMQLQLDQLGGSAPGAEQLPKNVVEQLLSGREHQLQERQAIAERMLQRKAQLDEKERQVRKMEEKLAREVTSKRRSEPSKPVEPRQSKPHRASLKPANQEDVVSLPEHATPTTPASTTAPPIPSSSVGRDVIELEKSSLKSQPRDGDNDNYLQEAFEVSSRKEHEVEPSESRTSQIVEDIQSDFEVGSSGQQDVLLRIGESSSSSESQVPVERSKSTKSISEVVESEAKTVHDDDERSKSVKSISEVKSEAKTIQEVSSSSSKTVPEESFKPILEISEASKTPKQDFTEDFESETSQFKSSFGKSESKSPAIVDQSASEVPESLQSTEKVQGDVEESTHPIVTEDATSEESSQRSPEEEPKSKESEEGSDESLSEIVESIKTASVVSEDSEVVESDAKSDKFLSDIEKEDMQKPKTFVVDKDSEDEEDDFFTQEVKIPDVIAPQKKPEMEPEQEPKEIPDFFKKGKPTVEEVQQNVEEVQKEVEPDSEPEAVPGAFDKTKELVKEVQPEVQESEDSSEGKSIASNAASEGGSGTRSSPSLRSSDVSDEKTEVEHPKPEVDVVEEPVYSESFSDDAVSTRRQTVSSSKDFEEADELSESIASDDYSEPEDATDTLSSSGHFLDLGATMAIPDSKPSKSPTPPEPPSPFKEVLEPTAELETGNEKVETISESLFPTIVKEAVDSAVHTVVTSPKKKQVVSPESDKDDEEEEDDDDEPVPVPDDDAFDKIAEVASRLRMMAGVNTRTEPPVPFLTSRRHLISDMVTRCVDFLWNEKESGQIVGEIEYPGDEISIEAISNNDDEQLKDKVRQFNHLLFDASKFAFEEILARPVVPDHVDDMRQAVQYQLEQAIGSPHASSVPQRVQFFTVGRRRDAVDEVLLRELYAEPSSVWTDFSEDEQAVREEVYDSVMAGLIDELIEAIEPFFPGGQISHD